MERVVFVEVLDRRGRVRERVRLDSFPATIGRAYTNRIIVDDDHICPEHVRISLDAGGALYAEDLGSVNGLYQEGSRTRLQRVAIGPDARIRIGHTVLRFRGPDHCVPPAVTETMMWSRPSELFRKGYAGLALFFPSLALLMFNKFLSATDEYTPAKALEDLFGFLLVFAAWAGIWSFVNRLVAHSFRFLTHLGLAGVILALFILLQTAFEYYAFLYSPGVSGEAMELSILGFIFFLLLFGHLSVLSRLSLMKRFLAALLVAAGIFGAIGFREYLESKEFSSRIAFPHYLKPLGKKWTRPVSTDRFFKELQSLKQEIETTAKKE